MRNHMLKTLIAASFLLATISNAGVFNTLSYSGRIVNSDGSPKEGPVDLEIRFLLRVSWDAKSMTYDFQTQH